MVLRIACSDVSTFERNLVRFISTETHFNHQKIAYVDCKNRISQYLFSRQELDSVLERLSVVRIDRAYDLLDWVRNSLREPLVRESHFVLISPYSHLLDGFAVNEKKNWTRSWERSLERLESMQPLHVIVMEEK